MHLHLFIKCNKTKKHLAGGTYTHKAGKISARTHSFPSPVHTGCAPLHDPPVRQVRECSPSKRYPGLQVKSHLESTSKPRVHVYLPCGIRCSTRQRISENSRRRRVTCGSSTRSRRISSLGGVRVCTYCGRKPSRTNAGSGGTGWSSGPAACIPGRTSSHTGTPECSCSGPPEERSRWPPRWSVSQSGTRTGLGTKSTTTLATVAIRRLIHAQMNLNDAVDLKI